MCLQDGPTGVRFAKGTSLSWQSPLNTASTFDKNIGSWPLFKSGKVILYFLINSFL